MALTAAERLRDWILSQPMSWTTEADLQQALADRMRDVGEPFSSTHISWVGREWRLDSANRIDFLVDVIPEDDPDFRGYKPVGVEVKIKSALAEVLRQLERYAGFDEVEELLLVTSKAAHHHIPREIGGKPLVLCSLVEAGL